jgi:hypothetical protein
MVRWPPDVILAKRLKRSSEQSFCGFVVQIFVYTVGFLTLAAIAAGGFAFFATDA